MRAATRTIAGGLAALLAVGLSAGCSRVHAVDAATAKDAHGPISIWYSNNAQEVQWGKQLVAQWNQAHPQEKVTGQEIPANKSSEEVIGASIVAGSEPCLIYNTSPASVPTFQAQGGLVALDDFPGAAQYIQTRSGDQAAQYKSPDGKYYQLPWKTNPVMIFYNKKIFAKAGISTTNPPLSTYSQFLDTAKKIVASKAAKYAIYPAPSSEFYQSWYDFYSMYAAESGGSQLITADKAVFADQAGQSVAQFWASLYRQNLAGKEAYNGDSFADGVAAMSIVGPWAIASYKGKVDWGVVPVPTSSGSKVGDDHTFSDAKNVAMYASCKNRATAWDFLKYSTSEQADGTLLSVTGQMPLRQDVLGTYAAFFTKNPGFKTFAAEANRTTEVPNVPNSVEIWQSFRNSWSRSVIFGRSPVTTSLTDSAAAIDKLIRKK
ncbi:sugar ABC transporter substrate-binding protein [Jatrophihabitans telluris]|uniref:Sugar ABC transporter substrate-binding protein n=1 Tax=Jatrophihabitans telluris TaxID=2038343 RepID=A0ABY4R1Q5_9ACTN|nr:sugar ABC transporter substrate-binding protein [Jatrophihabitans telluris]UQX89071.1 sugar ABC transporter substrate-binding protein [Jatrophihabitans telluris]